MTAYVAFLRAVNVGGTGKLPMADLRALCDAAGFSDVATYIASGNAVFRARGSATDVQSALEAQLHAYAGKPVGVFIRSASDLRAILEGNPFPEMPPNRTVAVFLDARASDAQLLDARGQTTEEIAPGVREIYIHYPDGQGRSKLKIPAASTGTARNMNTVAKLVGMVEALETG